MEIFLNKKDGLLDNEIKEAIIESIKGRELKKVLITLKLKKMSMK